MFFLGKKRGYKIRVLHKLSRDNGDRWARWVTAHTGLGRSVSRGQIVPPSLLLAHLEEFPCFLYLIQIFVKSHVETRNHHHHHSMNFETPPAPTTKFLLPSKFSSNSCDKDKNENPLQVCKRKYFRFYNAHDRSSEVIFHTLDDPEK